MKRCCNKEPEPEHSAPIIERTVTGCECAGAGLCPRHNCAKTEHFHDLCRTRPKYFALWEAGKGPCIAPVVTEYRGLGDVVAWTITKFSFGLIRPWPGCGCHERKQWLNSLWNWKKKIAAKPSKLAKLKDVPKVVATQLVSGITTAPRETKTLATTVKSLQTAGFRPYVFPDAGRNAMANWIFALRVLSAVDSKYVAIFQDDILSCFDLHEYILRLPIPKDLGCLSLYTPGMFSHTEGINKRHDSDRRTWGACALVFPTEVARKLPETEKMIGWGMDRRIDIAVGEAIAELGLSWYYHGPSLVQHVGEVSAFGDGRKYSSTRQAQDFVGEGFKATDLLKQPVLSQPA